MYICIYMFLNELVYKYKRTRFPTKTTETAYNLCSLSSLAIPVNGDKLKLRYTRMRCLTSGERKQGNVPKKKKKTSLQIPHRANNQCV